MTRREIFSGLAFVFGTFKKMTAAADIDTKGRNVSLIRLIATPHEYDNKKLRLIGFFAHGTSIEVSFGLYLSEADAQNGIIFNAVPLQIDTPRGLKYVNKYVVLEGTFHSINGSAGSYYTGYLDHIEQLQQWRFGEPK